MNIEALKVSEGMTFYLDGLVATIEKIYTDLEMNWFGQLKEIQMAKIRYTYGGVERRRLGAISAQFRQVSGKTHTHYRERIFADDTRTIEHKNDGVIVAYYLEGKWMVRKDKAFEGATDDETLELMRICSDE